MTSRRWPRPAREAAVATVVAFAVAVITLPSALLHPATTVPGDLGDPLLQAWEVAWVGHSLTTAPSRLFDANIFYPLPHTLAFSDSLLGYAPAGLLGSGPTAALVRYNLLMLAAWAFAGVAGYLLARQLGVGRVGAAVAGLICECAPWRLAQVGHLNIVSSGGIILALAMLARGHGIGKVRGPTRPGWAFAGWAVAAWQITLGFSLGLPALYVLALLAVICAPSLLRSGAMHRKLAAADAAGAVLLLTTAGLMAVPYLDVARAMPEAHRTLADVALFSPPWHGLATPPQAEWLWRTVSASWRSSLFYQPEMTLAMGLTASVLAILGCARGTFSLRRRLLLGTLAIVGLLLCLGTTLGGAGFEAVRHLPGVSGIRTPGRLIVFVTIAVALLAANAVDHLICSTPRYGRPLGLALAMAVILEGIAAVPIVRPTPPPTAFTTARAPIMVLPSTDYTDDTVMWWSTAGFPSIVNGSSGVVPRELTLLRARTAAFPAPPSLQALRAAGVETVVQMGLYGAVATSISR